MINTSNKTKISMSDIIHALIEGKNGETKAIELLKKRIYPGWIFPRLVLSKFYNKSNLDIRINIAEFIGLIGVDLNKICGGSAWTILHFASRCGSHKCAEFLLKFGANVNANDISQRTALHEASRYNKYKCAEILLKFGANIDATDVMNKTALWYSSTNYDTKCLEILLKHGADTKIADRDGHTPLHVAAAYKKDQSVKILLKFGADTNAKNNDGRTPLTALLPSNIVCRNILEKYDK